MCRTSARALFGPAKRESYRAEKPTVVGLPDAALRTAAPADIKHLREDPTARGRRATRRVTFEVPSSRQPHRCHNLGAHIDAVVHAVVRFFLRAWIASSSHSWSDLPTPTDRPNVHTAGVDPDRVLLIGNGISVGYGVLTHELGLPGMLARRLTVLTGRATDMQVRSSPTMTVTGAVAHLSGIDVAKFDDIIVELGGLAAVMLRPAREWRDAIEAMVASLLERAPTSGLFFIASPTPELASKMPWLFRAVVSTHTRTLNAITREVCARSVNATFVEFDPSVARVPQSSGSQYREWAELIAAPIAAGLDRHLDPHRVPVDEDLRIEALEALGFSDALVDAELDQIVATARDLFGVSGATLNAIDRTRQWGLAAIGMSREVVPRERSVCARTIASRSILVVEDTEQDNTYPWKDWIIHDGQVRFYAAYPIESPDGQTIGTLCVVDTRPRPFTATDRALLRDLAMYAQEVLWGNTAWPARAHPGRLSYEGPEQLASAPDS